MPDPKLRTDFTRCRNSELSRTRSAVRSPLDSGPFVCSARPLALAPGGSRARLRFGPCDEPACADRFLRPVRARRGAAIGARCPDIATAAAWTRTKNRPFASPHLIELALLVDTSNADSILREDSRSHLVSVGETVSSVEPEWGRNRRLQRIACK